MEDGFIKVRVRLPQKIFEKGLPEEMINNFLIKKAEELSDEIITNLERYPRRGKRRKVYERYTQGKIDLPFTSELVRRGKQAKYIVVVGAAQDEPPQIITGGLKDSIKVVAVPNKGIRVSVNHPLAKFFEDSPHNPSQARPFIRHIVDDFEEDVFIPELKALVKELLRGKY